MVCAKVLNRLTGLVFVFASMQAAAAVSVKSFNLTVHTLVGGNRGAARIVLSDIAPIGGQVVTLTSTRSAAGVPPTVTIPAGIQSLLFSFPTLGVSGSTPAQITASIADQGANDTLTINPATLKALILKSKTFEGGGGTQCEAILNGLAGGTGLTIPITGGSSLTVPPSVTFPNQKGSLVFLVHSHGVDSNVSTNVSGPGGIQAPLTLIPATLSSITFTPNPANAGTNPIGRVYLRGAAGPSGITIGVASDNTSITVPATVTIAADKTFAGFVVPVSQLATDQTAKITATLGSNSKAITANFKAVMAPSKVIKFYVQDMIYDPVRKLIYAAPNNQDGSLYPFDPVTGASRPAIVLPSAVNSIALTGDQSCLLLGCVDSKVRVYNPATKHIDSTFSVPGVPIKLFGLPGTRNSFALTTDPWTYVFDGATQRPKQVAIGIATAFSTDGIHVSGGDFRTRSSYYVTTITSDGFSDPVGGDQTCSTSHQTYQFGHPVTGEGLYLDPTSANKLSSLPLHPTDEKAVDRLPDGKSIFAAAFSPHSVEVFDLSTMKTLLYKPIFPLTGGIGKIIYAGPHHYAYCNFSGTENDIVIATDYSAP